MGQSRASSPDEAAARARDGLLATKLNIPETRRDHLGRPRLIEELDVGLARDVILVCTPAGFGKTTLLADWARRARGSVAWLSLDPEDNDPMRFWRYVVVALDRARGGVGEHVLPLLGAPGVISSRGVVTTLVNALGAAPGEFALVLDDYHVVESVPIHDDMAYFLGHLPPRLHVVIASRSDPPLPLARLRARGKLTELRAGDLRFTPDESSALLREVWDLDLSPEAIAALDGRTEGWAVGLQLAALSLRQRPDPDAFLGAFTGTHRYVLDYLSEEVLERQPDQVRAFLLRNSILERLTGPLCNAVTGDSDGQDMLEAVERANLFLIPLDEERRWYRFHHLFRDLLRARLQRVEAGQVPELHRRAAAWYERHGLIDDAIRHALASGDWTWAAGLVEEHLNETLRRGETVILENWLSVLPDDAMRSRPALSLAQGLMHFHLGHLDRVERLMEHAERAADTGRERQVLELPTGAGMVAEVPAAIALLRAQVAGMRGDTERMADYARRALAQMAEEEHGPRFWARWLSGGGADWMRGRLARAERVAAEMLAEGRAAADPDPLMTSCYSLAGVQRARGELGAALRTFRESLRFAAEGSRSSPFHACEAHVGIAQVLYERNQLDDALHHVTEGIELGKQVIWFFEPGRRLVTLAWIRKARGDADGALEALNEACRMHPSPEVPSLWLPAPSERARLLLALGRAAEAERWTEERGLTAEDEVSYLRERDYLVLARVLLARSEPGPALRLLQRIDRLAETQGRLESLIQIRAVRALALQSSGDHQGALALLADALTLARPEGYVRVFADEGPPLAALLRSLISARQRGHIPAVSGAGQEHVNRVARAFAPTVREAAPAGDAMTALIDPLTSRELEVLRFVAAGKRNSDIARELVVTLETVKKHVSNINGKLGASSRTQAVALARELGLIS
jgi:LuxR family maltose regulon positive regulatory protein